MEESYVEHCTLKMEEGWQYLAFRLSSASLQPKTGTQITLLKCALASYSETSCRRHVLIKEKSRFLRMKVRENSMVLWCICPVSLQNTGSFISLMHPSPKSKRQPSNSLPSSRCTTNLITYPSASTNSSKLEVSVSCLFRDVDCPVAGRFCLRSSWKSIRLP